MSRTLLIALILAGCSGAGRTVVYAGPATPLAGACDPPAQAALTVRGEAIIFVPDSGTLELRGLRNGMRFTADLNLVGADKKPYKLVFSGNLQGRVLRGTYITPRCRYSVALARTGD